MDEVAVYNTALSAGQIVAHYQAKSEPSSYYYTVEAVNASGSSAASNEANALTSPVATTTTLSAFPSALVYGQSVTLTATVSPATATGRVAFWDGTARLGDAVLQANG